MGCFLGGPSEASWYSGLLQGYERVSTNEEGWSRNGAPPFVRRAPTQRSAHPLSDSAGRGCESRIIFWRKCLLAPPGVSIRTYWHPNTQSSAHPKSDSAGRGWESRITFRNPFPILFHRPADSKHYNWLFLTGFPTISKTFPYCNTPIYILCQYTYINRYVEMDVIKL